MFSTVGLLLGCAYLASGAENTTTAPETTNCAEAIDNWSVDYVGKSGQFKLELDCNSTLFLKIKMKSITEYDASGKKTTNKVTSFAGNDFEWLTDDGEDTTYQGQRAITNTYTATLEVGTGKPSSRAQVPFNLTTYFFLENGTLFIDDDANSTYYIRRNSLKWEFDILNWPFESDDNTLQVCMDIQRGGSDSSGNSDSDDTTSDDTSEDTSDETSDDSVSRYTFGNDWVLDIPTTVLLDGNWTDNVTVTYTHNTTTKVSWCWQFNSFSKSLYYDPIAYSTYSSGSGGGSSNGGDTSGTVSSSSVEWGWIIFGVAIGVVIIGALVVYFSRKNKQRRDPAYQQMLDH